MFTWTSVIAASKTDFNTPSHSLMKHFSASKIALLLAFASQVQGSAMVERAPSFGNTLTFEPLTGPVPAPKQGPLLHDQLMKDLPNFYSTECIRTNFGLSFDNSAMIATIYEAPASQVIDAFIACPHLMASVYHDKVYLDEADSLAQALARPDEKRARAFYEALTEVLNSTTHRSYRLETVKAIYRASLLNEVPTELYLDAMKFDQEFYLETLMSKIISCGDNRVCKETILNILFRDKSALMAQSRLKSIQRVDNSEIVDLIAFYDLMEDVVKGEGGINANSLKNDYVLKSFLLALILERNLLAEDLALRMQASDENAMYALKFIKKNAKYVRNLPDTYRTAGILFEYPVKDKELKKIVKSIV